MQDWESYWKTIYQNGGSNVFWDSNPELAALEDMTRFSPYMDADLPLLDLGCGTGKQTRFLSKHFKKVVGVDISSTAVQLAIEETIAEHNIEFQVLNAVDTEDSIDFHREFGDVNIYMRGVLHMIPIRDRQNFVSNLGILLGEKGVLYQIELPTKAFYHLRALPEDMWSTIPKVVRRVGFNLEDRKVYFPEDSWTILAEGDDVTIQTAQFEGSANGGLPANFLITKRKNQQLNIAN